MDGGNGTGAVWGLVVDAPFFTCTVPAGQVMKQGAMETRIRATTFLFVTDTDNLLSALIPPLCI